MSYHQPVLASEVARLAAGRRRVVDATLGGGGHSALFLEAGATVLGIDRDPDAIAAARARLGTDRFTAVQATFGSPESLAAIRALHPDMVFLDLGISSHQIDADQRGFSFRPGVPLDMRMGESAETAADLLNGLPESSLADIFHCFGDEPRARKLARVIARRRNREPLRVADDLVNAIRETLGKGSGPGDFARIFQSVRIAVNHEIHELEAALPAALEALEPGGVVAVIAYHSGEDRVVKNLFREWARSCICPPKQPVCTCRGVALGAAEPRKPIVPSGEELAVNARSRSARLRVFIKALASPPPSGGRDRGGA